MPILVCNHLFYLGRAGRIFRFAAPPRDRGYSGTGLLGSILFAVVCTWITAQLQRSGRFLKL